MFGHTHEPLNKEIEGVLFVNPGQGYKSFMVDCTMAQLTVNYRDITAEIVVIEKGRSYWQAFLFNMSQFQVSNALGCTTPPSASIDRIRKAR